MECTRYVDQPPVKAAIHGRVLVWRAQLQTSADILADVGYRTQVASVDDRSSY